MSRLFIVGAHMARGGTYMAYHVGLIVADRLGLEPIAVQVANESAARSSFTYREPLATVPIDDLVAVATAQDMLVCNPSWSSRMFGTRFPGRSLMYVQGVNTYSIIDGFFDHYVACSQFVHDHLALMYGWDVPIIAPFVHTEQIGPPAPFEDRPAGSVAVVTKTMGEELQAGLEARLAAVHPDIRASFTPLRGMSHPELLSVLQRHRYLLTLAIFEGYGLTPVEAMLSGCCVVGFHGNGGLEYMRPGVNSEVVGFPRIDAAADHLAELIRDPQRSAELAAAGRRDVGAHTYAAFQARWSEFVETHLVSVVAAAHV